MPPPRAEWVFCPHSVPHHHPWVRVYTPPPRGNLSHLIPNTSLQCTVLVELTSNIVPHSCSGRGPLSFSLQKAPPSLSFSSLLLISYALFFHLLGDLSPHLIWLGGFTSFFSLQLQKKCMSAMWNLENQNAQNMKISLVSHWQRTTTLLPALVSVSTW